MNDTERRVSELLDDLRIWDHNVTNGMERATREPYTEFNKGSQFGQNEVLKVVMPRLQEILEATK
jgi:hypothetical protein